MGCDEVGERERSEREGTRDDVTGLSMTLDLRGGSEIEAMRYDVRRCGTQDLVHQDIRSMEDLVLPGGIPAFEGEPLDEDSEHRFADYFRVLEPGCYDVTITPMSGPSRASERCEPARAEGVEVVEGKTTEILLVSQCDGESGGAIDVIATLNHPPEILKLSYHPGKFLSCPAEVKFCATVRDPDRDPVRMKWVQLSGPDATSGPEVVHRYTFHGKTVECVRYTLPDESANYFFGLKVFDLFHLEDELVTAEEWYEAGGYGQVRSRATLKIPAYVSCPGDVDAGADAGSDVGGELDGGDDSGGEPDVGEDAGSDVGGELDGGEPSEACPRGQGYWKNHNRFGQGNQYYPWPIDEDMVLCGETWLEILNTPPEGDAWYILAVQYIAARLNAADGVEVPIAISLALDQVATLLGGCPVLTPGQPGRDVALGLATLLEAFNEGQMGPESCQDDDQDGENDEADEDAEDDCDQDHEHDEDCDGDDDDDDCDRDHEHDEDCDDDDDDDDCDRDHEHDEDCDGDDDDDDCDRDHEHDEDCDGDDDDERD
ncbi:hypothetical protein DL240_08190 [Lujinxingia litoralis]|uniref:Uncharacterized protein n=2 Tax=Lujinxingia litoralis TaxID=2211119 RepID=A0A328C734_9DELT|nr:hypothetical protein DL240_08190 [Lujinxingia litoralis]